MKAFATMLLFAALLGAVIAQNSTAKPATFATLEEAVFSTIPDPTAGTTPTAPSLDTFFTLMSTAELGDLLQDPDAKMTIFAPSDDAFVKVNLTTDSTAALTESGKLAAILSYHVIKGQTLTLAQATKAAGTKGVSLKTAEGSNITVTTTSSVALPNGRRLQQDMALPPPVAGTPQPLYVSNGNTTAQVIYKDLMGGAAVIHIINDVLLPPKEVAQIAATVANATPIGQDLEAPRSSASSLVASMAAAAVPLLLAALL